MKRYRTAMLIIVAGAAVACNPTNRLTTKNQKAMFTIEQIKAEHSKVKSGADFPEFIHQIKKMGLTHYETFVTDGRTDYYGAGNYTLTSAPKYASLTISENTDESQFKTDLTAHQQGKTDYLTFCKDAAKSGIEKWAVSMDKMTCTYFDKQGKQVLVEAIPQ